MTEGTPSDVGSVDSVRNPRSDSDELHQFDINKIVDMLQSRNKSFHVFWKVL